MDESDHKSKDTWLREVTTRPDLPALKNESEGYLMEIRGASEIVLRPESDDPEAAETEQTIGSLDEALRQLKEVHWGTERTRVRLLLCMREPYAPEPIISFLDQLQELPDRPRITLAGCDATEEIRELVDVIEPSPGRIEIVEPDLAQNHRPPFRERERFVEINMESYESAKLSPLPALRLEQFREMTHDPDLTRQPKHPDIHVVSAIDFDGSIFENEPEYGIVLLHLMRFVKARNAADFGKGWGNLSNLDQAIVFCENWAREREDRASYLKVENPIKYKKGIIMSDTLSAAGFRGMPIEHLRALANEFVETSMKGRFYDHTPLILQLYHDYGVLPFLVTGMPHVLVKPICKKMHETLGIGITHGNGLRYELDSDGRLTGRVDQYERTDGRKEAFHMGTSKGKARNCSNVIDIGYGLIGSVGDSQGDLGIWGSSIRRMPGVKWDWDGGAVLLDAEGEAEEDVDDNFSLDVEAKRFEVLHRRASKEQVYDAAKRTMESVFRPHMKNIENIKRIRDILTGFGFPDDEKREIMSEYYPLEIVNAALKDHNLNTKNENDFARHLRRIGMPEDRIHFVLMKNREYYQKRNVVVVPLRKRSSFPPPPSTEDSDLPKDDS